MYLWQKQLQVQIQVQVRKKKIQQSTSGISKILFLDNLLVALINTNTNTNSNTNANDNTNTMGSRTWANWHIGRVGQVAQQLEVHSRESHRILIPWGSHSENQLKTIRLMDNVTERHIYISTPFKSCLKTFVNFWRQRLPMTLQLIKKCFVLHFY